MKVIVSRGGRIQTRQEPGVLDIHKVTVSESMEGGNISQYIRPVSNRTASPWKATSLALNTERHTYFALERLSWQMFLVISLQENAALVL
jgi:hypothetical protein